MTMRELLVTALAGAQRLKERYPGDYAAASVVAQLSYLLDLQEGRRSDWARIGDLTLGILAVREIEPLDESLAALLYEVADGVQGMRRPAGQ
jgi:hypothetical protein